MSIVQGDDATAASDILNNKNLTPWPLSGELDSVTRVNWADNASRASKGNWLGSTKEKRSDGLLARMEVTIPMRWRWPVRPSAVFAHSDRRSQFQLGDCGLCFAHPCGPFGAWALYQM